MCRDERERERALVLLLVRANNKRGVLYHLEKPFDIVFLCVERDRRKENAREKSRLTAYQPSWSIAKNDTAVHLVV